MIIAVRTIIPTTPFPDTDHIYPIPLVPMKSQEIASRGQDEKSENKFISSSSRDRKGQRRLFSIFSPSSIRLLVSSYAHPWIFLATSAFLTSLTITTMLMLFLISNNFSECMACCIGERSDYFDFIQTKLAERFLLNLDRHGETVICPG